MNKIIALEIAIILSSKFGIIKLMVFFLNIQEKTVKVNTNKIFFSSLLILPILDKIFFISSFPPIGSSFIKFKAYFSQKPPNK